MYNELMHDEKERTKPMKAEDFTKWTIDYLEPF
jgi:hypothetical protein